MVYKNFKNLKLSSLGLGCMRFPTKPDSNEIDIEITEKMVDYAIKNGINYFDTAYGYHDGKSELVMGEILKKYPRENFYLADKFPGYDLNNMDKVESIFEEQLKKCQVSYFDFYLFHCLNEENIDCYLDESLGIMKYLKKQKQLGRIKHLGFSAHASLETLQRFLTAYGDDLEFCQLQINWLDWDYQNAKAAVELVKKYNLAIWVMEPVRGGRLINLAPIYQSKLNALNKTRSNAEWCFRFIQSLKSVTVTLSGMSSLEQLEENVKIFSSEQFLTEKETDTLFSIGRAMSCEKILPCTACRYCESYCPKGLAIPSIISAYNEHIYTDGGVNINKAFAEFEADKLPSSCIACRKCEAVCPQSIKISQMMKEFADLK